VVVVSADEFERLRERARVVAWLRGRADRCQKTNRPASASEARWNANEIEHGQHMKEGGE
jgi:hypothetical protein